VGVAVISNRTRCRLEIGAVCLNSEENRTQAGHAHATKGSDDLRWVRA
jgi:hypothetical protein